MKPRCEVGNLILPFAQRYIMPDLTKLLSEAVRHSSFDTPSSGVITPEQLRQFHESDLGRNPWLLSKEGFIIIYSKLLCPQHLLTELLNNLRSLLKKFLSSEKDSISFGMNDVMGVVGPVSVEEFARTLIKASALLGPDRVVELLYGWIGGRPIKHKTIVLLRGVTIDNPFELRDLGMRIVRFPELNDDIPVFLLVSHGVQNIHEYGVVLSVDSEFAPALYKPENQEEVWKDDLTHTYAWGKTPRFLIHEFCEGLSLVCNHSIRPRAMMVDCSELRAFASFYGETKYGNTSNKHSSNVPLSQEQLKEAWSIYRMRFGNENRNRASEVSDIAIRRWIKSKQAILNIADNFIDLRISFESLYLNEGGTEIRFRLATRGAWHLAENPAERIKYYERLSEFYKTASKAVHTGEIKHDEKNKELLRDAQDICLKGILKILRNGKPDWNKMILGDLSNL